MVDVGRWLILEGSVGVLLSVVVRSKVGRSARMANNIYRLVHAHEKGKNENIRVVLESWIHGPV